MAESTGAGRFVWYDLMSPDTDAATAFYTQVLGWGTRADRPLLGVEGRPPYTMWTADGVPIAGLVPFNEAYWLGYVAVPDLDRSVAQAQDLGGEIIFGPAEIANVGRFGVINDPQAVPIALFQAPTGSPAPPFAPKLLEFSWHELATTDRRAAVDFYRAMFQWETIRETDMGPLGVYHVFGQDGVPYGGMFDKPHEISHPTWCYYVRVEDVKDAANKVQDSGGRVITGPVEVPGGDRVAHCLDVSGGAFAVHQIARPGERG